MNRPTIVSSSSSMSVIVQRLCRREHGCVPIAWSISVRKVAKFAYKRVSQVYRIPSPSTSSKHAPCLQSRSSIMLAFISLELSRGHTHTNDPALGPVPPSVKLALTGVLLNRKSGLESRRMVCRSPLSLKTACSGKSGTGGTVDFLDPSA
jgi:hypothetical protein